MAADRSLLHSLRKDKRAVGPAVSTTILTSAIIVMLLVTINFANNYLNARIAENEFSAMKQFMQTIGLQIDDVAWTIGRTQTTRYSSKFGDVSFQSIALNYSVYLNESPTANFSYRTGVFIFDMPIDKYNIGNDYYEAIFPSNRSFLQEGTSAPISHVYVIEKLPMNDGNYIRVVVAPSIRMLNSTIVTNANYSRFYLPILNQGPQPRHSQSVTLEGTSISATTVTAINKIKISLSAYGFPKGSLGFDNDFFKFEHLEEEPLISSGSTVQFYTGEVRVSLGLSG
jgi:hypothetical protein